MTKNFKIETDLPCGINGEYFFDRASEERSDVPMWPAKEYGWPGAHGAPRNHDFWTSPRTAASTILPTGPGKSEVTKFDEVIAAVMALPGLGRGEFEKQRLGEFTPSGRAERRMWRFEVVMEIKQHFPELQGRFVARSNVLTPSYEETITDGLIEILHKANFRRAAYGYDNHRRYSEHLAGLARNWTPELSLELITHVEKSVRTPEQVAAEIEAEKARQFAAMEEEERLAITEKARKEADARQKALDASDALDELSPELLESLQEQAERGFGAAAVGTW